MQMFLKCVISNEDNHVEFQIHGKNEMVKMNMIQLNFVHIPVLSANIRKQIRIISR